MPKSKRDKKISLTKTAKKGTALKERIVNDIRYCVEKYKHVYLFTYENLRTESMKAVREQWKPSRFFFGKNKVMAIGFGRNRQEEFRPGLNKFAKCLQGQCGLLFTDCETKEVIDWFENFEVDEYARSGFEAQETVSLKAGPLTQFPHAIEPYLRQLGMPTKLDRGVVTLRSDFDVCTKGNILNPEQAKILQLLDQKLAVFKLILKVKWSHDNGFEQLEMTENFDWKLRLDGQRKARMWTANKNGTSDAENQSVEDESMDSDSD